MATEIQSAIRALLIVVLWLTCDTIAGFVLALMAASVLAVIDWALTHLARGALASAAVARATASAVDRAHGSRDEDASESGRDLARRIRAARMHIKR